MTAAIHNIPAVKALEMEHPVYPEIKKYYMTVRAIDLPAGIRKDANARDDEGRDLRKPVYRDVYRSLVEDQTVFPSIFDIKNKGIVILAEAVNQVADCYKVEICEGQGIVDGGHTYEIIVKAQEDENIPEDQHVEVQLLTGVDADMITEISSGLNTGIAVKHHSIANLDGKYDWIKEEVDDQTYAGKIAWRESDDGDYDVRDLICVMEALNVIDYPNDSGSHPTGAYSSRDRITKKFSEDAEKHEDDIQNSTYYKLRLILKDALYLYDIIRHDFREIYNNNNMGNAGGLSIVEKARKGRDFEFPFAGLPNREHRLTKGALYPIFAAFRNKVEINQNTGEAEWAGGFQSVIDLWEKASRELVLQTQNATKDINHKPEIIGKSSGHWNTIHKTVEVYMLRCQTAQRD